MENTEYANGSIENGIERIKDELRRTDHMVVRFIEDDPSSEFNTLTELKEYRRGLRDKINEFEILLVNQLNETQG